MALKGRTILITGANRGIGLGLAQVMKQKYNVNVIGTTRKFKDADELKKVATRVLELDVEKEETVFQAAETLKQEGIKLHGIINNAGYFDHNTKMRKLADINTKSVLKHFDINTLGPIRVLQAFAPLLDSSPPPLIVNISSSLGSIGNAVNVYTYDYRLSKTALNMLTKLWSIELKDSIVVAIHPGWVKTDMGTQAADLKIEDSISGITHVLDGLSRSDTGKFISYDGKELPW